MDRKVANYSTWNLVAKIRFVLFAFLSETKGQRFEEQGTPKLKTRSYKNYFNNIDLFYQIFFVLQAFAKTM